MKKKINNFFIVLIAILPYIFLNFGTVVYYLKNWLLVIILICACLSMLIDNFKIIKPSISTILISTVISAFNYSHFVSSASKFELLSTICTKMNINVFFAINLIAIFLILVSIVFLSILFENIILSSSNKKHIKAIISFNYLNTKDYLILLFISIVVITVASTCSPLFQLNVWDDSNAIFTVGKSILNNKMPYLDLVEQKGPVIFFINTLGALISYKTFYGIYIIEIISCFLFLLFALKTIRLFIADKNSIYLIPILSILVYTSPSFCYGDSVEEFCLPIFMYGIYVITKAITNETIPSRKELIFIGITSSFVLWMKFNILGFYIGLIIFPFITAIKNKKLKEFFLSIIYILFGVLLVTIPILLFFLNKTGGINSLFTMYFVNNMFSYAGKNSSFMSNIIGYGLQSAIRNNSFGMILSLVGLFYIDEKNKNLKIELLITFITMFVFIYIGGTYHHYYSLVISSFSVFGIIYFYLQFDNIFSIIIRKFKFIYIIVLSLLLILFSNGFSNICKPKLKYIQYQIKEDIESYKLDNPTVLNYGMLDKGIYTVLGITPNVKVFYIPNFSTEKLTNIQNEYIKNKKIDFIVAANNQIFDGYKLVKNYDNQLFLYVNYDIFY